MLKTKKLKQVYTIFFHLKCKDKDYLKDYTIADLQKKILKLKKYYNNHKFRKFIVFSKFYYFVNDILIYKCRLKPIKMLEIFIILESINKYLI